MPEPDPPLNRDDAIAKYQSLVWHEAIRAKPWALERLGTIEDVAQIGFLGLLRAFDYYQPGKGVKFITYATFLIRRTIRAAHLDGGVIRVPHSTQYAIRMRPDLGSKIQNAGRAAGVRFPGESKLREHVDPLSRLDGWSDVEEAMATLPPRLRHAINLRYFDHLLLSEIGERLGCGKERARQLVNEAMGQLRDKLGQPHVPFRPRRKAKSTPARRYETLPANFSCKS